MHKTNDELNKEVELYHKLFANVLELAVYDSKINTNVKTKKGYNKFKKGCHLSPSTLKTDAIDFLYNEETKRLEKFIDIWQLPLDPSYFRKMARKLDIEDLRRTIHDEE